MPAPLALAPDPDPTTAELIAARPHLSMHAMDGLLMEGVPLNAVADAVGSPTWVLSANCIRGRLRQLQDAMAALPTQVHYAVKANDHLAVLRLMAQGGAGADVVSGGEMQRALRAGIPPAHIVFSGVGKSVPELHDALQAGVGQVNAESAEELAMLSAIAAGMGATARVALRINPDVDAGTHAKITTGRADNKFGIAYDDAAALYAHAAALPGLHPVGLALHIGSQIMSMTPYRAAYARTAALVRVLRGAGQTVDVVDCGGGLGIPYRNEPASTPAAFAGAIRTAFAGLDLRLAIEPGRWLVAPAGVLLTSVILSKTTAGRRFVVLDAAMNDLARPAMYDAWHGVVPVSAVDAVRPALPADIVGPVCETGDTFARGRALPHLDANARLAILDAGAYGSVMSSTYNSRPLAAQVMVDGSRWSVIRARQPVEALWAAETAPDWFG
ncbi:MAG TPA: diaminopimelate decarboxylase [Acetobacteraceae bacterium]